MKDSWKMRTMTKQKTHMTVMMEMNLRTVFTRSRERERQFEYCLAVCVQRTRELTFGEAYILTAPREERKKMIRNEQLPTVSAVIVSDLDRRDLCRNQFLTVMDDAIAESVYQKKKVNVEEVDGTDLVYLVTQAYSACEN